MSFLYIYLWTWLQPAPPTQAPANGAADGVGGVGGLGPGATNIMLLVVMFLIFYFLLIRPQQKRQREQDAMLKALQKGDKVRTSGGIRGEIVDIGEHDLTLQIADRVRINILRAHIAGRESASGNAPSEVKKD